MRSLIVLVLCSLFTSMLQAQQLSGVVRDESGKPIPGASVILKKIPDSSVIKINASDSKGHYGFPNLVAGNYFVTISNLGFATKNSPAFAIGASGTTEAPEMLLSKAAANLKEVVVTYHKPMIEVKADKIVMNVEGSINAVGEDALQLLRKSPGVMVDKDDNLSLSGKNGVAVYIDGRPTPLTGKDLSEYLKSIQSSSIESIEIISNPSAKYDAAGNAGIINIKLKKNKSFGTNGSVNAGYAIGTFPKYNAGFSFNNRSSKVNVFGNYNYNNSRNESYINLYRTQLDTLFNQAATLTNNNSTHNFKAGLDYFLDKKNTLGVMVSGTLADKNGTNYSRTPISYIPDSTVDRILVANNSSTGRQDNLNANLNYRFADTSGHELNVDADYGSYHIRNNQLQPNYYYDPSGMQKLDSAIYNMLSPSDINIYSLKADYEENFKKGKLGLGAKSSFVNSDNVFQQYNVIHNDKLMDTSRTNHFIYKENINAVYANYNRGFKGWSLQAGLRIENTNSTGVSNGYKLETGQYVSYDSNFDRHYTDFFPSAGITYNKNPMKQWILNYSRRIDRPAYQDLNPFEFRLDEYTFQKGNTNLRPQYTNSIGLTYMYKYRLTATLNYSHVSDVFTQLVDTIDKSKAFISKQNLATQDITSLNISYPFQYKWYSVFGNVNTYYSKYTADFGTGRTIDLDVFAFSAYAQNSFKLGKTWTGELTGWYSSPSIWQGTFKTKEIWSVDAGLQKTVMQGKMSIKASVSDIFNSLHWHSTSDFAGQTIQANGGWESRLFKINLTYRFGSNEVKAARQHKSGSEDEDKRVGSQGGGLNAK